MKKTALLFILLSVIIIQPTFAQKKKWAETKYTHTIEAYQAFIKKYPKSDFKTEARTQIDILEKEEKTRIWEETARIWEEIKITNTIEAYKGFRKKYSNTEFAAEAKSLLVEMEWQRVAKSDTHNGYENYLKYYPDSKYAPMAKEKLESHSYRTTSFTPSGRTTTQGNETGYMEMTVFKSFSINSDKRELIETLIGKCSSEEYKDGLKKCTYVGLSFWTENEKYYWQEQGEYNKIYGKMTSEP